MHTKRKLLQLVNSIPVFKIRSKISESDSFKEFLTEYYCEYQAYLKLYKQCLKCHGIETKESITFSKSFEFGSSVNEVKSYLTKLKFQVIDNTNLNTRIIFYKMMHNKNKSKCHFHFFEEKIS